MPDPDYFTLAELAALPNMGEARYTEARKLAAAAHITSIIERECRTSFVARSVEDEIHSGGRHEIFLKKPYVLSVTSATENGVTVTDDLRVSTGGVLTRFSGATSFAPLPWLPGVGNVSVTYEAGYSETPPEDIKEAALRATRWYLLDTNSNAADLPRQTSVSNDVAGSSTLSTGGPTGYPSVDSVIEAWRRLLTPGLA